MVTFRFSGAAVEEDSVPPFRMTLARAAVPGTAVTM